MSIIGSYRHSGITDASGSASDSLYNFTGYKPSGLTAGNILGVALYVWSGSTTTGDWVALRREWL